MTVHVDVFGVGEALSDIVIVPVSAVDENIEDKVEPSQPLCESWHDVIATVLLVEIHVTGSVIVGLLVYVGVPHDGGVLST